MSMYTNPVSRRSSARSGAYGAQIDIGLRQFMLQVYAYMAIALGLTGAVAAFVASTPAVLIPLLTTPLKWVAVFSPVAIVLFFSARINTLSANTAQTVFWIYATAVGISSGMLVSLFTGQSVARVFFITAGTFGAMSLYGYTTQRDLSSLGSFFIMAVLGLFLASIVNIFLKSTGFMFVISALAVLVFVGLTAYDTQSIRQSYLESDGDEMGKKKAVFGALMLYIDFIALFQHLLVLLGDRR